MDGWEDHLRDDLREVAEELRTRRYRPTRLRLDELKRQVMARSARKSGARQGRRFQLKSKIVTLLLVLGLVLGGGAAGVIAAGDSSPTTAAKTQYKCNSGNGNGSEIPPMSPSPDCDPGNSPSHNNDNSKEGPGP